MAAVLLVLLVIGCSTYFIAREVAGGIVEPVNRLIDVVHAFNNLDFSGQVRTVSPLQRECPSSSSPTPLSFIPSQP